MVQSHSSFFVYRRVVKNHPPVYLAFNQVRSVVIEFTRDSIQSSAPCSRVPSVKEKGVGSVSLIIALE